MEKEEYVNMETAKANTDLKKTMDENNKNNNKKEVNITETNIAIQKEFYSENSHEEVIPTYISNGTQAKFIDKDN